MLAKTTIAVLIQGPLTSTKRAAVGFGALGCSTTAAGSADVAAVVLVVAISSVLVASLAGCEPWSAGTAGIDVAIASTADLSLSAIVATFEAYMYIQPRRTG
jgi:hypothetical protein